MGCENALISNIAVCRSKNCSVDTCLDYNRNVALGKCVVEKACFKSENAYDEKATVLKCRNCNDNCPEILSPQIITSPIELSDDGGVNLVYSEFSGYTAVTPPGYITIDLGHSTQVQTIQFLLWDNRGNAKVEACDIGYHYRLLVSDYKDRLVYNETIQRVCPQNASDHVEWTVLHDTLRLRYNGWQVFHLDKPLHCRYIRLHLVANSDDELACNVVRLEAYSKRLVGYTYNYLPTFEKLISTEDSVEVIKGNKNHQSIRHNPIIKFPIELDKQFSKSIEDAHSRGNKKLEKQMRFLQKDVKSLIAELSIYDNRITKINDKIFKNTNRILHTNSILKIAAIAIGVIGLVVSFIMK